MKFEEFQALRRRQKSMEEANSSNPKKSNGGKRSDTATDTVGSATGAGDAGGARSAGDGSGMKVKSSKSENGDNPSKTAETTATTATTVTEMTTISERWRKWRKSLQSAMEDPNAQMIVLAVIYIDLFLGSWSMTVQLTGNDNGSHGNSGSHSSHGSHSNNDGHDAVEAQQATTIEFARTILLYFQLLELLSQLLAFHFRFFSHWGYAIDSFLVVSRMWMLHSHHDSNTYNTYNAYHSYSTHSYSRHDCHLHLLTFLRTWRLLRLIQTFLQIELQRHALTQNALSSQIQNTKELKVQIQFLEGDVERERVLRVQNEEMARGCREEMQTLREALKIAALDVAVALKGSSQNGLNGQLARGMGGIDGIGSIDVVEYDEKGEDGDIAKAWVTHPLPRRENLGEITEESSVD